MNILTHITPFLAICGYLLYPTSLRINPSLLYYTTIVHNSLLIGFSAWTFMSLANIIYHEGIHIEISYYFQNPTFDKIIHYFYLSKYYEFVDTFILYLSNKSPILLQKYHHIGALIIWHLFYVYKLDAIWFPSIVNSFVHTIMYSYYLGSILKVNFICSIKPYITILQLTQLLSGVLLCHVYYDVVYALNDNTVLFIFNIFYNYVIGLICLFGHFYYKNYIQIEYFCYDKDVLNKIV